MKKRDTAQRAFLLLLVVVITGVFLWMIRSFLLTIVLAATFATLAYPLFERIERLLRGRRGPAAGLTLLAVVLGAGIPASLFAGAVAQQALKVNEGVRPWVQQRLDDRDEALEYLRKLPGYAYVRPYAGQILEKIGAMVSGLGNFFVSKISAFTAGTILFLVQLAIGLYVMFFFLVDGPAILRRVLYLMPLSHEDEMRLLESFRSMARATVKGTLVIGLVQGGLAGAALGLAGVPSALFWTTVMVLSSMIPTVGSALVWLPAAIYLFVAGEALKALLVIVWCAVVVGSADNLLRPALVGKDTRVHEVLILLSTLGGIMLFGLAGFILGPVVAVLFLTVWDIYGVAFKEYLPDVGALR